MVKRCVVQFCGNSCYTGHTVHSFPKDSSLRRMWEKFVQVKRANFAKATDFSVICEQHFTPDSYADEMMMTMGYKKNKYLKDGAIPTIQPIQPEEKPKTSKRSQDPEESSSQKRLRVIRPKATLEVTRDKRHFEMDLDSNKKRGRRCVVYGCSKTTLDGVTLFKFPRNERLANMWETYVQKTRVWAGRTSWSLLCSDHFPEESFELSSKLKRQYYDSKFPLKLKDGAMPTLIMRPPPKTGDQLDDGDITISGPNVEEAVSCGPEPKQGKVGGAHRKRKRSEQIEEIIQAHEELMAMSIRPERDTVLPALHSVVLSAPCEKLHVMEKWSVEHPSSAAATKEEMEAVGFKCTVGKIEPGLVEDVAVTAARQVDSIGSAAGGMQTDWGEPGVISDSLPARNFECPIVIAPVKLENDPGSDRASEETESVSAPEEIESVGVPEEIESVGVPEDVVSVNAPEESEYVYAPQEMEYVNAPEEMESDSVPEVIESVGSPEGTESDGVPEEIKYVGAPVEIESDSAPEETESVGALEEIEYLGTPEETEYVGALEETASVTAPEETESSLAEDVVATEIKIEYLSTPEETEYVGALEETASVTAPEETESSLAEEVVATEVKIEIESAMDEYPGLLQNATQAFTSTAVHPKEDEQAVRNSFGPDFTDVKPPAVFGEELDGLNSSAQSASKCVQLHDSESSLSETQLHRTERTRRRKKINICQIVYQTELKTPRNKINICQIVSTTSEKRYNLRKRTGCDYLKLNESGEKAYKCRTCSKSLPTQAALKSHILDHARKTRYKCAVCKKYFAFLRNLKYHEFSHKRGKVYQCSVCKRSSDVRIGLKSYMHTHSACLKVHMSRRNTSRRKRVRCDVCSKSLSSVASLTNHMYTHSSTKPFKCSVCDKSFRSRTNRNKHFISHTDMEFQCSLCGKLLRSRGSLKKHMFSHTGEKPFQCSLCSSVFAHEHNLKLHMRTHTGEKPFHCSLCPNRYACSTRLKHHMRMHTGVKPFSCQMCAKSFTTKSHLERHMRVHTGEKPFQCSQCSSSFNQRPNLKIHMLTHTGEKPHLCPLCGRGTTTKQSLEQHMHTHTKQVDKHTRTRKTFKCSACSKCLSSAGRLKSHMRSHKDDKR